MNYSRFLITSSKNSYFKGYLLLLVTLLIWGSFTLISRFAVKNTLTPWDITAVRFSAAALILLPIQLYRRNWHFLLDKRFILLSFLGGFGYASLAYDAFNYAPAAHAAIWLNGMLPFFTALSAYLVLKEVLNHHIKISLIIIAIGLGLMAFIMHQEGQFQLGIGDVLFVAASACWGFYTALLKRYNFKPWQAMCGVGLWSFVLYVPIYILFLPKKIASASFSQIATQAVFQGWLVVIVAMLSYIGAVKHLGAFKTGSILALAPLLAALLAVPILHEPLTPAIVVGLMAVSLGALQPWRWFKK